MKVAVRGCAVCAPGLPDWPTAREVLAGRMAFDRALVRDPAIVALPANERRRLPATARAALGVGIEALQAAGIDDVRSVATVFASCGSDGDIIHRICEGLAQSPPDISPTRFHNSVHNAPGGYWSIAFATHAPSTSLCAFDASFAAGLVEAAAQVVAESATVLLIAYDLPYPPPLASLWNVSMPFSVALVLAPEGNAALATIDVSPAGERLEMDWPAGVPAELRTNPSAASIPLLELLARGVPGRVALPHHPGVPVVVALLP